MWPCGRVWLCVCESVCLCFCLAVWPCGCVAVWLCGRVAVWPCGRVALCGSVWLCVCESVCLCFCLAVWPHGCVAVWLRGRWLCVASVEPAQGRQDSTAAAGAADVRVKATSSSGLGPHVDFVARRTMTAQPSNLLNPLSRWKVWHVIMAAWLCVALCL